VVVRERMYDNLCDWNPPMHHVSSEHINITLTEIQNYFLTTLTNGMDSITRSSPRRPDPTLKYIANEEPLYLPTPSHSTEHPALKSYMEGKLKGIQRCT
jgi:hypothetical protein